MADQIPVSVANPAQTVISPSLDTSTKKQQPPAKEEPGVAVASPKIKISDVAQQATSERKDSLLSLNESASELREAISALNAALARTPTKAIITRDEELNRFVVRIADKRSGEVVREIPSEALLKFARNLQELKGLIFDTSL